MSRIGKLPIPIPSGVTVEVGPRRLATKGPKGSLEVAVPPEVSVAREGETLVVKRQSDSRRSRAFHGLARKLVANAVEGVSKGFARVLEIHGVGYRAEVKGNVVHLSLGFSHPIAFQLPVGVTAKVEKQTILTLESADLQVLGQVTAMIRELRPPEPYKGKGIRYADEIVRKKAGKAAGAGAA